jgi:hypothetical protein
MDARQIKMRRGASFVKTSEAKGKRGRGEWEKLGLMNVATG